MSPADAAAYAALDVQPGAAWPIVHDAWRRLMKRHHPDAGAVTVFDARRVREANAAYSHLRRLSVAGAPVVTRSRHTAASRTAVWNVLWAVDLWPCWMPGVRTASGVVGASDRRVSLAGRWGGHRVDADLAIMLALPPCRLAGRLLGLRVDGEPVLGSAPRVWASIDDAPGGTRVELGIGRPDGRPLAAVFVAALDAALVEIAELAGQPPIRRARSSANRG